MKVFSKLPWGELMYESVQKSFGRLNSNPSKRIPEGVKMIKWLHENNISIKDKVIFEVGTVTYQLFQFAFSWLVQQKYILSI